MCLLRRRHTLLYWWCTWAITTTTTITTSEVVMEVPGTTSEEACSMGSRDVKFQQSSRSQNTDSCRKGEPSLAPPLRYRQQSIHTSMLGTFLIFWRRLLPARGRLGGMMTCWVGLL